LVGFVLFTLQIATEIYKKFKFFWNFLEFFWNFFWKFFLDFFWKFFWRAGKMSSKLKNDYSRGAIVTDVVMKFAAVLIGTSDLVGLRPNQLQFGETSKVSQSVVNQCRQKGKKQKSYLRVMTNHASRQSVEVEVFPFVEPQLHGQVPRQGLGPSTRQILAAFKL
jgi:hypothetical protein